jgi:hypothetical protein
MKFDKYSHSFGESSVPQVAQYFKGASLRELCKKKRDRVKPD